MQAVYDTNAFKTLFLHCFDTKVKQEDVPLVQIQKIAGLREGTITSTMVALVSLQQTVAGCSRVREGPQDGQWPSIDMPNLQLVLSISCQKREGKKQC